MPYTLSNGSPAPDFSLPATDGKMYGLKDFASAKVLVIFFTCNHCPYVKHIRSRFAELAKEYQAKGVGVVGINSNDIESYPDDGPEKMAEEIKQVGYTFPYLSDESQEVAKAYRAACTPDFYLFDGKMSLVYRGQLDDARPGNSNPVNGSDLRAAMASLLAGKPVSAMQKPSIGCNIKWKKGNEPDYF